MLDFNKKNENDILNEIYSLYQNKYDELMDYAYCEISSYLNGSTSELKRINIEIKECIDTIKSRTDWDYSGGLFYQYNEYCYNKNQRIFHLISNMLMSLLVKIIILLVNGIFMLRTTKK